MNQQKAHALVAKGYTIVALQLGSGVAIFRPVSAFIDLTGAPLSTTLALFDSGPAFGLKAPDLLSHPLAYAGMNTLDVRTGDILVQSTQDVVEATGTVPVAQNIKADTYFVARLEAMRPPLCVLCAAYVSVLEPAPALVPGLNTHGGRSDATDQVIASLWPASILPLPHGDQPDAKLPSDVRAGWFDVVMPAIPGIVFGPGLRFSDNLGRTFVATTGGPTDWGWQFVAVLTIA